MLSDLNPPAMREAWVQSLGWEDPLEKGKATHSSLLTWRTPRTVQSMGHKELDMNERLACFQGGASDSPPLQPLAHIALSLIPMLPR